MRSYRANHNVIAVSAGSAETAINTEQPVDLSLMAAIGNVIALEHRRENNSDEATGLEEPDMIYDNGSLSKGSLSFPRAQPQHFAFLLAYGLGVCATTAAGGGYLHTITPISGDKDLDRSLPSFTAMQRYGLTVLKRRFVSMFVESVTASFKKDSWVELTGEITGTGKHVDNVVEETISAAENATTLALAENGVQGATAAQRLDNVQRIRAELSAGVWTEVSFSAVSAATPAEITITAPGVGTDPITYKVLYVPTEDAAFTFPAKVQETPLRVAQLTVTLGGVWNGSAFSGGRTLSSEINALGWKLTNNLAVEFVPGAGGSYAASAFREGRNQTVSFDRRFRETILQQHVKGNDTFGLRILAQGAEYETGHNYQVEIIFPKLAVLTADPKVDGKVNAESGDLQVLEDATYGSVIVKVKNLQSGYAA